MNTDKTLVRQSAEDTAVPSIVVDAESGDNPTTRRMLLTGGAVTAGAAVAALASTVAEAAPVYLQLGVNNASGGPTRLTSSASPSFLGVTTASGGICVQGYTQASNAIAVNGTSTAGSSSKGVEGIAANGYGVFGTGYYGVYGSGSYAGIYAAGNSYGGIFYGGPYGLYAYGSSYGLYANGSSIGVYGNGATGLYGNGSTNGVYGAAPSSGATVGVRGANGQYSVYGLGGYTAGVRGDSNYVGVWSQGKNYGVYGTVTASSGAAYGVFGSNGGVSTSYAGYFQGNVAVAGTLAKSAGSFKIDHPLDPDRKWLQHSFVESPDMMNVYNGNVTTDASGNATVTLPDYFTALNRDFRYQLTVIGKVATAIIAQEIANNQFRIHTTEANTKVSWQVTGIRQDDYAKTHPIVVELAKSKDEAGARAFVAPGVSARVMQVGPAAATIKQ